MTVPLLTILIVCSDERGPRLAHTLVRYGGFHVFVARWSYDLAEMEFSTYDSKEHIDDPVPVSRDHLPEKIDGLFFHTGFPDRGRVPKDILYGVEFAFSEDGLSPLSDLAGRTMAIPIAKRYMRNGPPLVAEPCLPELVELIHAGERRLPEWLGADEPPAPLITTLGILCQAYLAAWISEEGVVTGGRATAPLAEEIGWPRVDPEATTHLASRLKPLLAQMRQPEWWIGHLIPVDPAPVTANAHKPEAAERRRQSVLAALIVELGLEAQARTDPHLRDAEDLAAAPAASLAAVLAGQPGYDKIAALLSGQPINDDTVVGAYRQVKAALDAR